MIKRCIVLALVCLILGTFQAHSAEKYGLVRVYPQRNDVAPLIGELRSESAEEIEVFDLRKQAVVRISKELIRKIERDLSADSAGAVVGLPNMVAWRLRQTLSLKPPVGKIAKIESFSVYASVGSTDGLKEDDELLVYRKAAEIRDPDTGEVLDSQRKLVARLKVLEVRDRVAKCKLAGEFDVELVVGDEVESKVKPAIAVFPLVDESGEVTEASLGLTEYLAATLVELGVPLVERTLLDKALVELEIQQSSLFDPENASKLGKLLGAKAVVVGRLTELQRSPSVNVRLIKVDTGEILFSHIQRIKLEHSGATAPKVGGVKEATPRIIRPDGATSSKATTNLPMQIPRNIGDRVVGRHGDAVMSVAFDPKGRYIVSGGMDGKVQMWPIKDDGEPPIQFDGHKTTVRSVAFSMDGELLASAGGDRGDNAVRIWNVSTQQQIAKFPETTGVVSSVGFFPDKRKVFGGSNGGRAIHVWDLRTNQEVYRCDGHTAEIISAALATNGSVLGSVAEDKTVRLWNPRNGKELATIDLNPDKGHVIAFSSDGKKFAVGTTQHRVLIYSTDTRKLLQSLTGHNGMLYAAHFSPDNTKLLTGAFDHTVRLWDLKAEKLLATLHGHTEGIHSVAFSPDGTYAVSGSIDRTVRLWNLTSHLK